MTQDLNVINYDVRATWHPRAETAEEIADRFRRFMDGLIHASPLLATWRVGARRARDYHRVRDDLTKFIEQNIVRDDCGVSPLEGFDIVGVAMGQPRKRTFSFTGRAGCVLTSPYENNISFHTLGIVRPDPEIIEYALFRSIVLTIATSWEPRVCNARPSDLRERRSQAGPYSESWILYIPPDLAKTVDPTGVPVVEAAPDGGLLLAATTEPFKTDNPLHFEGARKVALAARHLNIGKDAEAPKLRPEPVPQKKPTLASLRPEVIAQMKEIFGDKWKILVADE